MFELVERLERMGQINRDIREAAATAIADSDRLVQLRADFNFECNGLLNNLTALMAGQSRTSLISRMQDEVVSLHKILSQFQQRWSIAEIKLDPEGYFTGSTQVHAYILGYIEKSLPLLAEAATPIGLAIAPNNGVALLGGH
jgi:hypothetical protein